MQTSRNLHMRLVYVWLTISAAHAESHAQCLSCCLYCRPVEATGRHQHIHPRGRSAGHGVLHCAGGVQGQLCHQTL